jgi:hypothetical protein
MPHLFGNQPDASWTWSGDFDSGHTRGSKFRVTAAGAISAVGFYRAGTGTTFTKLMLFHENTTMLWSSTSPVDDVTFGWKWTPVVPPIAVTTGVSYYVCANFQGNQKWSTNTVPANRASPPAEFIFDDLPHWWAGGVNECPTYASTANFFSVSAMLETPPEPIPGPGEGDPTTTGDLNSWLSADPAVQTHEADGLPWITNQYVQAVRNVIGDLADAATSTGSLMGRTAELLARTATILARLPADILTAIKTAADATLSWLGTGPKPAGALTIPDRMDELAGRMLDLQLQLAAAAATSDGLWHRTQTSNWLDAVPGGDWVLQDTLEFDAPFAWNQPADVYVVHITNWPLVFGEEEVAGLRYLPRAFWWAPLTGTIPHERHFGDFEFQAVHNLPLRCEGIVCRPRENVTGTVEAWLRSEPLPGIPVPPVP